MSDWGVASIVLSDYMDSNVNGSTGSLISTAISMPSRISSHTHKTAHQSTISELKAETFRQLKTVYPNLPVPDKILLSPGVIRKTYTHDSITKNYWDTNDTAF